MRLVEALRYSAGTILAFVGAGGKTTALFTLARELTETGEYTGFTSTVLVTSTTHFGSWQAGLADHTYKVNSKEDILNMEQNLPKGVLLLFSEEENDRLVGLDAGLLEILRRVVEDHHLPLLIEADGSRTRPLKAPAEYEPAIPDFAQTVVVVAGLSGLGKNNTDQWVHRPEIFAKLSGLHIGEEVSKEAIVSLLHSKNGGLKNIPLNARKILLLNQADTLELLEQGKNIADQLKHDYHSIILSSLNNGNIVDPSSLEKINRSTKIHAVIEQVAGIILAAGKSSRFGRPKQLLLWKGQTFIRHVILAALHAGLSPVIVVVGDSSQKVISTISNLPVRIVKNSNWKIGVSSSIKTGVDALPRNLGGVIFFQADQPQVSPLLIKSLVEAHEKNLGSIIAPQIDGQRGNPVLFDVRSLNDLHSLQGDIGGRALYSKYPVDWIPWLDPNQLLDIDNPEDYQKFLEIFPDNELNR